VGRRNGSATAGQEGRPPDATFFLRSLFYAQTADVQTWASAGAVGAGCLLAIAALQQAVASQLPARGGFRFRREFSQWQRIRRARLPSPTRSKQLAKYFEFPSPAVHRPRDRR